MRFDVLTLFPEMIQEACSHSIMKRAVESDIISIPSIIGIDDYSLSLNKTSDPGATLFILEEGKGNVIEYNIKL